MINKRLIFPLMMFTTAGISFVYGTWQFIYAQRVQASSDARITHVVETIERSDVARQDKQELYATIAVGLPEAPTPWGIDFSGSFASTPPDDRCANDGQRSLCRVLERQGTDAATYSAACGQCDPR
jgi:hypothetical protein